MVSWYSDNINLAPVHTLNTQTYSTKSALSNNEARTLGTYSYDTTQDLEYSEVHDISFSYVSHDYPPPTPPRIPVNFKTCFVRNLELDNTLPLNGSSKLIITAKVGQVLYIDNLPDHEDFDTLQWVAMLCDESKTTSTDPIIAGDYSYKAFCVIDRAAKTLTFDGGVSLAQWSIGNNLVLYNPFLNYTFTAGQVSNSLLPISGAPWWRNKNTGNGPMFKHSDGRFIAMFLGFSTFDSVGRVGYMSSTDMINWTIGNGDNYVFASTSVTDTSNLSLTGDCYLTEDGTGRYYCGISCARSYDGHGVLRVLYFDEDLTTFSHSDPLIPDVDLGAYSASLLKIGSYYHMTYMTISSLGLAYRTITAAKSLVLDGPYTDYQIITNGYLANDGEAWCGASDAPTIHFDGTKVFGLFGAQSQWSKSGTKGNREYCLIDFDPDTEVWSVSPKGPVLINPMYYQNLPGAEYLWAGDHCGGYPAFFYDGSDTYVSMSMKGSAAYQYALLKLAKNPTVPEVILPADKIRIETTHTGSFSIRLAGTSTTTVNVDWGDGVVEDISITMSPATKYHTYTGAGGTILISTPSRLSSIVCGFTQSITSFDIPETAVNLKVVGCSDNNLTSFIGRAEWTEMETIALDFNQCTRITIPYTWPNITIMQIDNNNPMRTFQAYSTWTAIQDCQVSFASMTSATSVNNILIALNAAGLTSAMIHLEGGTNAAPTGVGAVAKNALIARGVTVDTN